MMYFHLNQREHTVLVEVLQSALGTLREGIYKTETMDFEYGLKERERVLIGLLQRMHAAEASGLLIGEPTAASTD